MVRPLFGEWMTYEYIYMGFRERFHQCSLPMSRCSVLLEYYGHWSVDVRDLLNISFPGRWIGRDGSTACPPRSPDIAPFDFFFWLYVRDRAYETLFQILVHFVDGQLRLCKQLMLLCSSVYGWTWNIVSTSWGQLEVHTWKWSESKENFERCIKCCKKNAWRYLI